MKKTIMAILTASLIFGASTMVFAAEDTGVSTAGNTPAVTQTKDQNTAKKQFKDTVYKEKMAAIADLRTQIKDALNANKAISDKIKNARTTSNTDNSLSEEVKAGREKVKNDAAQLKTLTEQKSTLHSELQTAKKNKDTATISSLQTQIKALDEQIADIKQQEKTDKAAVQPLATQLKTANDAKKQKHAQLQPLEQQNKDLHQKIAAEKISEDKLMETYKTQFKAGDFTSAGNTLQSIVDTKTQRLNDIKAQGDVLNQILSAVGSSSTT